jgi:hypothetical protein
MQTGLNIIAMSISGFDPSATSAAQRFRNAPNLGSTTESASRSKYTRHFSPIFGSRKGTVVEDGVKLRSRPLPSIE